ncbi:MAG: hypothetical protein IKR19_09070 [Acholeplasmatales bacterium]|nr:hypothetical protein [Acholeplasmatales bacterium]
MNKRQAKKWRKKHFVAVSIPYFAYSSVNANCRSYSPDIMLAVEMHYKKNPIYKSSLDLDKEE